MDLKLMAEIYRLGISIGYYNVQDVIKWADKVIENLDSPPYEIIDISLSAKEKPIDICFKLKCFKGEIQNDLPPKIILGLLNEYLNKSGDTSEVIQMMDRLNDHMLESFEWIEKEFHYFSDAFYLAEQKKYGNKSEVISDLKQFLIQIGDYTKYLP
ncbi:hypothetical protein [Neobacillus sp. CF12]|uniref:hypothetical protein n=1 Tax=Neobacillus sp. CF12 TaxID=3055864 RepID=UPI0025A2F595|nr:hypothetical protein [Neobacillus sp. CF12]MDM5326961.1 hypothetical protein [Neobacillus sp. CF12]